MASDLYSDSSEGEPMQSPTYGSEGGKEKDEGGGTALLPKAFFPEPPEPGKKCSIRVVSVEDDQVEVEYDHEESPEDATEQAEMADMGGTQGGAPAAPSAAGYMG